MLFELFEYNTSSIGTCATPVWVMMGILADFSWLFLSPFASLIFNASATNPELKS